MTRTKPFGSRSWKPGKSRCLTTDGQLSLGATSLKTSTSTLMFQVLGALSALKVDSEGGQWLLRGTWESMLEWVLAIIPTIMATSDSFRGWNSPSISFREAGVSQQV